MSVVLKRMMVMGSALALLAPGRTWAVGESLCATVKIEIQQELTLERQAFDAHMRINNGLEGISLENVDVDVSFKDAEGGTVLATSDPNNTNALFFIRLDRKENIADVDGAGVVAASTSADIHWLIIPAHGASGPSTVGTRYAVGAHLRYKLGSDVHDMDVIPDTILVKPMPKLVLDYFLPRDVYGDDAFTVPTEVPVPFSLGVRVSNGGPGSANGVKIESGQLKIVENKLGLLVGFTLKGSEVNGLPAADSLLVDFGNIAPLAAGVARWYMECSLSGRFTEFTAEFSHGDELGGRLTSLIDPDGIRTHELVHDVLVDLPGRDRIRDFLAKDDGVYRVYESDSLDAVVTDRSTAARLEYIDSSVNGTTWRLHVPETTGPFFVAIGSDRLGYLNVSSVLRSDGKQMDPANVWVSKTRSSGNDPWVYSLNLFDVNGGGTYEIGLLDAADFHRPVLSYVGNKATWLGDPLGLGFLVQASDPDGTIPVLTAAPLPAGAEFTVVTSNGVARGTFFWRPVAGQTGIHGLRLNASDGVLFAEAGIDLTVVGDAPILNLRTPSPLELNLELNGIPGTTYVVEYRTNLLTGVWGVFDTITLPTNEIMVPVDISDIEERAFYLRVREP